MTSVQEHPSVGNPAALPDIETFWCNVTGQLFQSSTFETTHASGLGLIQRWGRCPHCDEWMRTVGHPQYNPARPQPHLVAYRAATGVQIAGGVLCLS